MVDDACFVAAVWALIVIFVLCYLFAPTTNFYLCLVVFVNIGPKIRLEI
jgi:hypothetical protein